MAEIKRLVETNQLKTSRLAESIFSTNQPAFFKYDTEFDALIFLVVPPSTETVAHYLDEHVALLYEPRTKEVVGLQVEDFEHSFIPQHEEVLRVWRLSDSPTKIEDFRDLVITVESVQPKVAKEVFKVTEDLLSSQGRSNLDPVPA
jgi:hypothetical protein